MSIRAEVLWFTGLSGSGKSTLATEFEKIIHTRGYKCLVLDGDVIRSKYDIKLGYSEEDIKTNNLFIARYALNKMNEYDYIVVPIISPFIKHRDLVRNMFSNNFHEIYFNCSLKYCMKRDVKGLYQKAIEGEISNMIGFSLSNPYEPPPEPELTVDTEKLNLHNSISTILKYLKLDT